MGANCYGPLRDALDAQRVCALRTRIQGRAGLCREGLRRAVLGPEAVHPDARGVVQAEAVQDGGGLCVTEPVLPPERLLLLGGGHVAQPVCALAARCGFQVTVVDDRPEYALRARFPEAADVLCLPFGQAVSALGLGGYDYVVIVTRGHVHDADCLRAVLACPFPAYVGMIGSRRRVGEQLKLLAAEGVSQEKLARVCTPIGLDIGSVTPEEIAVSIVAQLIAYRRLPCHAAPGRWVNGSDLEPEVVRFLAASDAPKAVVTLLSSSGSSPRKAGAKMAVLADGSIVGSVGGGLGEHLAVRRASALIGTGRYELLSLELDADAAARDGMACGGRMELLLEDGCAAVDGDCAL